MDPETVAVAGLAAEFETVDREDVAAMNRTEKDALVKSLQKQPVLRDFDDLVALAATDDPDAFIEERLADRQHQANTSDGGTPGDPSAYGADMYTDGGFAANATAEDVAKLVEILSNVTRLPESYLESLDPDALAEMAEAAGITQDPSDLTGEAAEQVRAVQRSQADPLDPPRIPALASLANTTADQDALSRQAAAERAASDAGYVPRGYFAAKNAAEEAEESEEGGVAEDSESDDMGVFDRLLGGDSGPGQNRQQGHPAAGQHGQPDGDGGEEVAAGSRKHGVNYTGRTRGQPSGGDDEDDGYVARGVFNELNRREAEGEEADD